MSKKFLSNTFLDDTLKYDPGAANRLRALSELYDIEPNNARAALDLLDLGKRAKVIDEDEYQSDRKIVFPYYLDDCDRAKRDEIRRKCREEDEEVERKRKEFWDSVEEYKPHKCRVDKSVSVRGKLKKTQKNIKAKNVRIKLND